MSGGQSVETADITRGRVATPNLHRLMVERDARGDIETIRFVCDGDDSARCHWWPDCGCEVWTRDLHGQKFGQPIGYENGHRVYADKDVPPAQGHEDVQQRLCWIDPWFNDCCVTPDEWADLFTGERSQVPHPDGGTYDDLSWLVSGPVVTNFEGDYMTWDYDPEPTADSREVTP